MKALLILKCEGRIDDGFRMCSGVENIILDLEKIELTANYKDLIKYLDSVVKLFDSPCVKQNIISNALYKLFELGYASEKESKLFSYFWGIHKICGLILCVKIKE